MNGWRLSIISDCLKYNFYFPCGGNFSCAFVQLVIELKWILRNNIISQIKHKLRTSKIVVGSFPLKYISRNYISSVINESEIRLDNDINIDYEYIVDIDQNKFIINSFDCSFSEFRKGKEILDTCLPSFSRYISTKLIEQCVNLFRERYEDDEPIILEFPFSEIEKIEKKT